MNKKEAIAYVKATVFKVKDFEHLKAKYRNYRKSIELTFEGDCRNGGYKNDYTSALMEYIGEKLDCSIGYIPVLYQELKEE
jgi:hypothetical protein